MTGCITERRDLRRPTLEISGRKPEGLAIRWIDLLGRVPGGLTMQGEPDFTAMLKERDAALAALDMDYARRVMPDATDDYVRLLAMHKARYEATNMPRELRHESGEWLRSRGSCRYGGLPILPEGELPQ